jgi:bacillopeptidase F
MVGGDGPGPAVDDIGVAYGATFISAKVLDQNNSFSSGSIVVAGAQWMLDPDGDPATDDFPSVINNSWFFFAQTYDGFHSTVAAWRAAGIVPVFCIGNSGPGASTTRVPASYENALGVGATTSTDVIASFSSRGPSPLGPAWPADQRKPDLSAPGQLVRSSVPGGAYQNWSGTSMAAPHVAGTVALMLEADPSLDHATIRSNLLETAVDLGAAGYDFEYGYGRLDAFAATGVVVTGVEEPSAAMAPGVRFAPNPFRDRVRIEYAATSGVASIAVFDLAGRRVWSAAAGGGRGALTWDGRGPGGDAVPAGVYLVRLTDGGRVGTGRVLRLR